MIGLLVVAGAASAPVAAAHGPSAAQRAAAGPTPVIADPKTELITTLPVGRAISGEWAHTGSFFYVSSVDSISVIDTTDPEAPKLRGVLPQAEFENEAMTYGERRGADGKVNRRFVLVGNDLVNGTVDPNRPSQDGVQRGRIGGGEVIVVDVTDPDKPTVAGRTPGDSAAPGVVTSSTHTVQCVTLSCEFAYTAGDEGMFSIVDLRDLAKPVELSKVPSAAAGKTDIFTSGAGHYWDIDQANRIAWHTGSGGAEAFDVSDPVDPKPLNGTNAKGTETPYNDFILHNSMRPNGAGFKPGAPASLRNGNVLLVTEEDYFNDGDEVDCAKAGTFQTWRVPDLDGEAYRAANPGGIPPDRGSIAPLDTINPVKAGDGLSTPAGAFCSAHWFDYHQNGFIAQGYYQQGMRIIDVRDPADLKQFGFFTPGVAQVWDAYWLPLRDAKGVVLPGRKSNLIYTVDAVRGVDVLRVDLPGSAILPADGSPGGSGGQDGGGPNGPGATPQAGAGPGRRCGSRRLFTIRLTEPRGRGRGRLRSARVVVRGKRVKVTRRNGRLTARIDLRGARKSRIRVRIVARTTTGRTIRSSRVYLTCRPGRR